ncbi:enoyl-CoA hydratase/isomerase family protein [Alcaligenes endophyticus]|uniref:Enoyl-CoA hydratase-related protein n=1 Tax=Alcaligenes endophyticus TaxID=1929088 RepID=A0ABT8EJI0_9BURK|nr:enoyl-CoA hydratase-related protein [Alcaligenes endophyticus]MCX5591771.1 enoyl-CoA hydratase-related protein [Alcaligenes endophyticus]MDN4121448.1 enoyl-CoA hydratase-related protein [Alcaligenes endophyticus]
MIDLAIHNQVAILTLQRPQSRNSLNPAMATALLDHIEALEPQIPTLKGLFLRASGDHFMVGGDIQFFDQLLSQQPEPDEGRWAELEALITTVENVCLRLRNLPFPVIAFTQGAVAGAGLSLALACDMIVAADNARFVMAYNALGATPDGGASFTLPERVGFGRALHMLLFNQALSAQQALDCGLVVQVCKADELDQQWQTMARQLASGSRQAQNAGKALLRQSATLKLEQALTNEKQQFLQLAQQSDFKEGVDAFLSKRPPLFKL